MSVNPMRANRNKHIRGHILFLLNISKTPTTQRALEMGMIESLMVTSPDITEYLDYLTDRGYIERVEREEYNVVYYKLTSRGVDILEGTIEDPGVLLNVGK
jgi:DNA-binding MarR family transcriptional regulator